MEDIFSYEQKLISEIELNNSIAELIKYSINCKKYFFDKSEFLFDISILQANNILIEQDSKIVINDSAIYYAEYFNYISRFFNFELTENISEAWKFVKSIEEQLRPDNPFNTNVNSFFRGFKSFVLFLLQRRFNVDYSEFIKSLNKESGRILYEFNSAYSGIVPYLSIQTNILYNNLNHLLIAVKSDAYYNSNIFEISNSIREYCKINSKDGLKFLNFCIEQTDIAQELITPSITGLYENDREIFWNNITELIKSPLIRVSVICSLSAAKAKSNEEALKHYSVVSILEPFSENELYNLPTFFISIINNNNITDELLKNSCFKKLLELAINSNQNFRQFVLHELQFIVEYDFEVSKILLAIVEDVNFDPQQIQLVGNILSGNKDFMGFINLLFIYGEKFKLDFKAEYFSSAIYRFKQESPEIFSKELIRLLTNDLGEVRYVGIRILEHITPENGKFLFKVNITEYDAITQYKLLISILAEIREPKYTLPVLFPLLKSTFSFVTEAFICKIEELSEDYGSPVLEVITTELDISLPDYTEIYHRIKNHCEKFWKEVSVKRNIKELNPLYTQSDLYTLFISNYGKSFNKSISEGVEKKSLLTQFAPTIVLAKGGGWKHQKSSKIEKLGQVSASFQLPRSLFIRPEFFDWEFQNIYHQNWKNKFKEWEVMISS